MRVAAQGTGYIVSVPYRGATFLNGDEEMKVKDVIVSVPYRGATFLNHQPRSALPRGQSRVVSVPYRGATFLNTLMNAVEIMKNSFRPLSGSYISQL